MWGQYLQYLQSYFEIFIQHTVAAVPLLETDNMIFLKLELNAILRCSDKMAS